MSLTKQTQKEGSARSSNHLRLSKKANLPQANLASGGKQKINMNEVFSEEKG